MQDTRQPSRQEPVRSERISAKTPSEADREIGELVRRARQFCGMTREALAQRIGVSYQQFQKYEVGANRLTAARLIEISRVLDVPMSTFVEIADTPPSDLGVDALLDDPAGRLIINAWPRLDKEVRDHLGALAAEIADAKP